MKFILILFTALIICSSCTTLNSLDDMNCKLPDDKSKNFIGKWKVFSNDKKFIWRFYSDNTTTTLENTYLTQIFNEEVFASRWQNEKIDTLKVFFDNGGPNTHGYRTIEYLILSNQCREIIMVNVKTSDTLILKRKQYFYQ
ncbi:hypothetical protein [Emticicia sp. BO119]|uniref:hypothetical protein n=1 Tax=Emticicia sp. BO119 TaxID=2757768 RepID=UPI0015F0771C|nr:hypothetical protein [Emticicia sp. BO119]MBA4849933.1 hypothetical protein [Emticicia sp. BO119]